MLFSITSVSIMHWVHSGLFSTQCQCYLYAGFSSPRAFTWIMWLGPECLLLVSLLVSGCWHSLPLPGAVGVASAFTRHHFQRLLQAVRAGLTADLTRSAAKRLFGDAFCIFCCGAFSATAHGVEGVAHNPAGHAQLSVSVSTSLVLLAAPSIWCTRWLSRAPDHPPTSTTRRALRKPAIQHDACAHFTMQTCHAEPRVGV